MEIMFERTGGFAGMVTTTTVDTVTLSDDESHQLTRLVQTANFFQLPTQITASAQPDRFQYHITVRDGARQHAVVVGEAAVPATLKPLIDWLMNAARHSRP